ncbi:DUF456 domain-containing protein [Streptomyces sp. NPDC086787]|uniref:DUF456 domain-containing protein n=1 Tax=Streptomyces sp. NPDC086787 TaxID=3365759 RepID=UPI0037F25997
MGVPELLLVGLVIALGVCGVLVPGMPGTWLVWAAVLWWALKDPRPLAWGVLVGATAVLLVAQVVRCALPPRRLRESGATPLRMTMRSGGSSVLAELFACLLIAAVWLGAVLSR